MGSIISFNHRGDFSKTMKFFNEMLNRDYLNVMEKYGKIGVERLKEATPKRTGKTAASWTYEIKETSQGKYSLTFINTNIQNGVNIAVLIDTGHGTSRGYYVQGKHYIDPITSEVLEELSKELWREVTE